MKDKGTIGACRFMAECIKDVLVIMMWYGNVVFKCLYGRTYMESKKILWIIIFISIIAGTFIVFRFRRTEWMATWCAVIPYGLYTFVTYKRISGTLIMCTIAIVTVLSGLYTVLLMTRKIKNNKHRKLILKNRIYQCLCVSLSIVAFGMAAVIFKIGSGRIFGAVLIKSDVKAVSGNYVQEETVDENMDVLLMLREDAWAKCSVQEKLNVLQIVANEEARYLGLPNELNVGTSNLKEYVYGNYSDETHTICLNLGFIEQSPPKAIVETICHEAMHSAQYRIIDAYNSAESDLKNLPIYDDAAVYAREFSNYDSGAADYNKYYEQKCESDSREYAKKAVERYYEKINNYLNANN